MNRIVMMVIAVLLLAPVLAYGDKAAAINRKGIDAYRDKKYDESVEQFTEALIERPDTPELKFNRGTALSAMGNKDEALGELSGAASEFKSKQNAAAAHYNAGNVFFTANDFRNAVEEYSRAVKLDQKSPDIRHNLELALRKLAEQKKNESKKDPKKEDEQKKGNQKNQSSREKQEKTEQDKSQKQQSDVQPMTKEEAERLLDAMNADEKKSLSLKNKQMQTRMGTSDDW